MSDSFDPISIGELMNMVFPLPDLGGWALVDGHFLEYEGPDFAHYDIDLHTCVDSAHVLDWVIQIAVKTWATDSCIAGLVRAFRVYLHPQQTICSWGISRTLTKTQIDDLIATATDRYQAGDLPRDP